MTEKRQFTSKVSEILEDEMAVLEAIDPGAIVRPKPRPPEEPSAQATETPPALLPDETAATSPIPRSILDPPAPPPAVDDQVLDEAAAEIVAPATASARPPAAAAIAMDSGRRAERSPHTGPRLQDAVSLLEIAPPQVGGVRESALPGDRAQHPPAPQPAPRIARANSVLFIAVLSIFTAVLAVAFFLLLVALFQLG